MTLDLVIVVAVFGLGLLRNPTLATLLALIAIVIITVDISRSGRSPAHRALGLRSVDPRTALPRGLLSLLPGKGITADLRRGRDPLRLIAASHTSARGAVDPWAASEALPGPGLITLVTDDGSYYPLSEDALIGRSPAELAGATNTPQLISLPDLSRTISRTHIRIVRKDNGFLITDLDSANRTLVTVPGGQSQLLNPQTPTFVPLWTLLQLGDRTMHLSTRRTRATP